MQQFDVTRDGFIEGYAAIFQETDLSGDSIKNGAFSKTLIHARQNDVKMLYQHKTDEPIGCWTSIFENQKGLYACGQIFTDTQRGHEIWTLIRGGALDGLSIGFQTEKARKQKLFREILEVRLWEISIVTFPMAPSARILKIGSDAAQRLRQTARNLAS